VCRLWIARGEQSGLLTLTAMTENVSLRNADEKLTAFVEFLESAVAIELSCSL
jgi:hypothetical protein